MNLAPLDYVGLAVYTAALLYLGYLTRRTRSFHDFAVGKNTVPATMVFASMAATIIGPGFSIGFTAKGWSSGYLFYYLALAYAAQVVLVGLFVAPRLARERDCVSIGEIMRKRYGRFGQFLTGIVSVGLCIGFTAVMAKVGGGILSGLTGIPVVLSCLIVTGLTALITFSGGIRATIATEALQFSFKAIAVAVLLMLALFHSPQTLAGIGSRAASLTSSAASGMSPLAMFGAALSFMLGEALIPPYTNRALASESPESSRAGFVAAGLFCAVWLAMVALLGVVAHDYLAPGTSADDAFVGIARVILPSGIFGLLLAALMAIVMGSQEAVLNSASVSFVRDVIGPIRETQERHSLLAARGATLLFAAAAVYLAQFAPSIIDGLLILYSIWAPTILIPLLMALYLPSPRPLAGWLSIIAGGVASGVWQAVLHEPQGIPAILVGLICCGAAYGAGHVLGSPATRVSGETQ
jgi:SSS family solute:Na+ symporter